MLTSASISGKDVFLLKRIAVAPTEEVFIDEKLWETIQISLSKNQIIKFDYVDRWKKKRKPKDSPYQLVLENDVCYLFGFDEMRNADRIFSLSRIKNAEIIEETFTLPEDFEFDSIQALKIKDWVLSAGCNARPFEPQWLADEWKRNAQEMSKMAEK